MADEKDRPDTSSRRSAAGDDVDDSDATSVDSAPSGDGDDGDGTSSALRAVLLVVPVVVVVAALVATTLMLRPPSGSACDDAIGAARLTMATAGAPGSGGGADWESMSALVDRIDAACDERRSAEFVTVELMPWMGDPATDGQLSEVDDEESSTDETSNQDLTRKSEPPPDVVDNVD